MKLDLEFIPIIMDKKLLLHFKWIIRTKYRYNFFSYSTPHDKWVNIAVVKTPTQLRLYTDGVLRKNPKY